MWAIGERAIGEPEPFGRCRPPVALRYMTRGRASGATSLGGRPGRDWGGVVSHRMRACAVVAGAAVLLTSATAGCSAPAPGPATTTPAVTDRDPGPTGPTCTTRSVLAEWSTTRLVQQTVVVPVNEGNVESITAEIAAGAGGVILFGSRAPADLGRSLARLVDRAPDGIEPFVMVDEEGGAVQRMSNLVGVIPSARQMAATMSPAEIEQLATRVGRRMRAAGVTMDLAPVLDLDGRPGPSPANPAGTRSFSPRTKIAEAAGLAFARGLLKAGVVPVVKHFPGLGGASGNTDAAAATTLPWRDLQRKGLLPFAAAVEAGLPAVMVGNAAVPGLTTLPASLSPEVTTGVLRERLRFSGLVITDSLSATAIKAAGYRVPDAAVAALVAGADMVLFTATAAGVSRLTQRVVQGVVAAVRSGTLSRSRLEQAVQHVLDAKHVDLCRG
jgi:beta-N-acetylhexosaminidase